MVLMALLILLFNLCFAQNPTLEKIVEYPTGGEYYDKDDLCVKDQHLFAASFYGLEIYDVEQDAPAQLISRLPLPGEARAIEVKDNYAYVQSVSYYEGYTILFKIDIANVYEPFVVQSINNENVSGYAQIDAYKDFIILKNHDINYNYYYSIYSIPELEFIQNYYCSGVFMKLNDSLAFKGYIGETFTLYDMIDPENITEIDQVDFSAGGISINNIQPVNDTILACIGFDGISFWNYSEIHDIQYISTIYSTGNENWANYLYSSSNIVCVLRTGPPGLTSIDISDIYYPFVVDCIDFTEHIFFHTALDITGVGNSIFTGEYYFMNQVLCNDGYFGEHYIINEYYGQHGGDVNNDYLYVNFMDGLKIYDVSSLPDIVPVDTLYTDHVLYSMQRVENFLFLLDYTDYKILVLDITDPLSPTVRNEVYVTISGSILLTDSPYVIYYIRKDNNKLYKYSIPEPNAYTLNFQYNLNHAGKGFIYNDYLYYIIENTKGSDLLIYGGLAENDPELITMIEDIGGGVEWLRMKNYDNIFYLSEWDDWEGSTMFYEIGEPTEITYKFSTPQRCDGEFFIDGDCLFTGGKFSHIYIFDLETASGLVEPMADYQDYGSNLYCKEYESNGQKYLYRFQSTAFSIYEIQGYGVDDEPAVENEPIICSPNPFTTSTTISFSGKINPHESSQIKIYNVKGQMVKTITSFPNGGLGTREVVWDGKDESGKEVGAGIYLYKVSFEDDNIVKKIVKIR